MKQRDPHALKAHHPAEGRHALLHVSRSTELTLLFQNEGQGWQSTSVYLDSVRSSDAFISHAALGEDGADLLAATFDGSSRLRLYRVAINWNASQHSRGQNIAYTLVQPTLSVHHLTAINNVRAQQMDNAQLTHLCIIPTPPETIVQMVMPTTVLAVFTHAALPTETGRNQGSSSSIVRWTVESVTPALHDSFKKLKPGGDSNHVLNQITVLRRQPDIHTHKVILSVDSQMLDTVLAFGTSDGGLDFRDRATMSPLGSYGNTEAVESLAQSGFEHLVGEHNVHVASSADGSALALVRADNSLGIQSMTFTHSWQEMEEGGLGDNQAFIDVAAVCVARQYAFLCLNNMSNDETLALLPPDMTPRIRSLVLSMIFRLLCRTPDISMTDQNRQQILVLKDPLFPRALSAQLALGTDPVSKERNPAAQYAFAMLSLRIAATACMQTLSRSDPTQVSATGVHSLRGLVRWSVELLIDVVKTLFEVERTLQPDASPKQALEDLRSTSGHPALHLLLCSFSRSLLRCQVMFIGKYFQTLQTALPRAASVTDRQEMENVSSLLTTMPFKLPQFDKLLAEFDGAVRSAYGQSGLTQERRNEIEIQMVVNGYIPPELEEAIRSLMHHMLPKITENIDVAKLCFWKTEWLGLRYSRPPPGHPRYDAIRKLLLGENLPLRVCRRCGSEMEDISHERLRNEVTGWFPHSQRHCVCMNYWLLK
jgi:mediator of RNA polymerase II transcription subunit 16